MHTELTQREPGRLKGRRRPNLIYERKITRDAKTLLEREERIHVTYIGLPVKVLKKVTRKNDHTIAMREP
jgi:hypothetical protein